MLSGNAADVLNSLQYIQDFGVNLICVEDGIDSSKDSGKLTITVLSAVAEIERERLKKQLRQVLGAKTKLTDMLDKLDVSDKHYDRKYQDMQDRLDNLYDKVSELEDTIADIDSQIGGAYEKQITAKQFYKILANFDKLYYRLTDLEKKEFLRDLIESVEIYPEKMDNGRMLKQINFNFPVYYDGEVGKEIRLLNENTVEVIIMMQYCGKEKK